MRISTMGPMTVIRWGRRLVYVLIFVAFVVAFGETDEPRTILFLVSLLSLTIIALFVLRDDKWIAEEATCPI